MILLRLSHLIRSPTLEVRVEPTLLAPVQPVVRPGCAADVAHEGLFWIGRLEAELEGVLMCSSLHRGARERARRMQVELALCAVIAEARASYATRVAVEGSRRVGGGREQGQAVLGVSLVVEFLGHLGADFVKGVAAGVAAVDEARGRFLAGRAFGCVWIGDVDGFEV